MRITALHGSLPAAFRQSWAVGTVFIRVSRYPPPGSWRLQQPVQVLDLKEDRAYREGDPLAVASVDVQQIAP